MAFFDNEARLYLLQRLSAVVMAPLVVIHLVTILYAVRGGLTAAEILERTQNTSLWGISFWGLFYVIFVIAVSVHAPLGLRKIMREWTSFSKPIINRITVLIAALLLVIGLRSVMAVTGVML